MTNNKLKKQILLLGADGMLGHDLYNFLLEQKLRVKALSFPEIDLNDNNKTEQILKSLDFDILINCTAYTNVDACETDKKQAYQLNATTPGILAKLCKDKNATIVHFSTDYVFDGKNKIAYSEFNKPKPINYYGKSKLAGEENIKKNTENYLIIRTAWLYGASGNNFVKKILSMCKEKETIKIVNDQFGSPTYTKDLSKMTWKIILSKKTGLFHVTNQGFCSWYDLANKVIELANIPKNIIPCTSNEYPTPAKRPQNSKLKNLQLIKYKIPLLRPWDRALKDCLKELSLK